MKVQKLSPTIQQQVNDKIQDKFIDHILTFDPLDPSTSLDTSSPQPKFLIPEAVPSIPWPSKLKPVPQPLAKTPDPNGKLPVADVLVVTWTVAEALALSDALTPGYRSKTAWYNYKHNWETDFKPKVHGQAPSLISNRLGKWFLTKIGKKSVVCFKSELHMARDGAAMPVKDLWIQLINEVQPKLLITTGTAGGIGKGIQLGDVIVTQTVRFDCNRTFAKSSFHDAIFTCSKVLPVNKINSKSPKLMNYTTGMLPKAGRVSRIITKPATSIKPIDVVTTDFFAFDDDTNDYKLQGLGSVVEMGDASLALACNEIGDGAPAWLAIRNASDPQIIGGVDLKDKADKAGRIYEKYGYWTTINSAISCWTAITSLT